MTEDMTGYEQGLRQQFYESALNDPIVSDAEARWARLSAAERRRAVERVVALQAKVFGFDPPAIEFEEMPRQIGGRYDRERNLVLLNSTPLEGRHTLFRTAHEAGHVLQRKLREDFRTGRIAPDDPRYALAEVLSLVDAYYIRPDQDLPRYSQQLSEVHANQYESGLRRKFEEEFVKRRSTK